METAMNVGVRPIDRPQSAGSTEGVSRRGDGGSSSAAFSPKTNVSIQSAVDDMAGILAKISSNQSEAVDKMPQDLQKVIQNVLKQAFSLEETMGQGLGSTLESQRFSMDQLSALSRMLSQLGAMAEKGMPVEVSDEMRALLSNLKALVTTENGGALEPVLLTKAAFELLDNKSFTELPKEVQALLLTLQPQGQVAAMQADEYVAQADQAVQFPLVHPFRDQQITGLSAEVLFHKSHIFSAGIINLDHQLHPFRIVTIRFPESIDRRTRILPAGKAVAVKHHQDKEIVFTQSEIRPRQRIVIGRFHSIWNDGNRFVRCFPHRSGDKF